MTPVLGIIQELNRHRATPRRDGVATWPTQAHLVYASRSPAELHLLNSSIINDARYACRSMLHAATLSHACVHR